MALHRDRLYIAGAPGGDSIGPKIHEFIANSLGLNWSCDFLRLDDIQDVMKLFRRDDFAGGIVTMPHKRTVIPFLDRCDELVQILGACNFVHLTSDGKLHGTNTDWVGIYDAIITRCRDHVPGRTGLVYGAGGASRAAIYALWAKLKCDKIYLVNRDEKEVAELMDDIHKQPDMYWPEIVHVRTVTESKALRCPYYIVCTVPDFEAVTPQEIVARDILVEFLSRSSKPKGIVVDMCYHPPMTRNLELAKRHGYRIIEGFIIVASQFECQWKLWTGKNIETEEVFGMTERLVLERQSETSHAVPAINAQ